MRPVNRTNEEKILDMLAGMSIRMESMDKKIDGIDNRLVKGEFRLDAEIVPRLDALSEGHAAILERLVPTTRVDELENRVKMLEAVLSGVTSELRELKKAQ